MQENFVQTSVLAHSVRRMEHRAWSMKVQLAGVSGQQATLKEESDDRRKNLGFRNADCDFSRGSQDPGGKNVKIVLPSGYRLLTTGYLSLYDLNEFAEGERLNDLN
jgi:hypothetical protein